MNRAQFMEQLEKLLSDISEEERQEALDYYESYFDDAGDQGAWKSGQGSCYHQGRPQGKLTELRGIHGEWLSG